MLQTNEVSLIDTVIHELCHRTIWSNTCNEFNESVAVFVAEKGTVLFTRLFAQDGHNLHKQAVRKYQRKSIFHLWMQALRQRLHQFYATALPRKQLIAEREEIFADALIALEETFAGHEGLSAPSINETELNNAFVCSYELYHHQLGLLQRFFDTSCHKSLRRFIIEMKNFSRKAAPFDAIKKQLQSETGTSDQIFPLNRRWPCPCCSPSHRERFACQSIPAWRALVRGLERSPHW
jgi:predicted aminopeptidase